MILSFWTELPWQIKQTPTRLLLDEQYDQGLHCLLLHQHFNIGNISSIERHLLQDFKMTSIDYSKHFE